MNGDMLQARIWKGFCKTARVLGQPYNHYRAEGVSNPISVQTRIGNFFMSLNAEDMKYSKPNKYGKPTWYGVFDGSKAKVGDYLIGPGGTFFIAAMQHLLPILLVECNRTITVLRPQQQTGIGAVGYGGNTEANETALLTNWPASILQGTKGEKSEASLPGDTRSPWWGVLMPAFVGRIRTDDIIIDDLGQRYIVSSPELTDLGWRLTAMMADA